MPDGDAIPTDTDERRVALLADALRADLAAASAAPAEAAASALLDVADDEGGPAPAAEDDGAD